MDEKLLALLPENITEYPNVILRQTNQPLEAFTIFDNLADAELYAKSEIAVPGQIIGVKKDDKYKSYVVQEDGKLEPGVDFSSLGTLATKDYLEREDLSATVQASLNKAETALQTSDKDELINKIDQKIEKEDGITFIKGGGTIDANAKIAHWTGESDKITEYYDGLSIRFQTTVAGSTTTKLKINNLEEKQIYRHGTTALTTQRPVNSIILLTYVSDLNGGCWMDLHDYDTDSTDKLRPSYARFYTADPLYAYKICGVDIGGKLRPLTLTSGTGDSKTVNAASIRPNEFYFYSKTETISQNALVTANTLYSSYSHTSFLYTFNSKGNRYCEIYLKGSLDSTTGMFLLDNSSATSWYVLVPYNTDITLSNYFTEGASYILIGRTYSSDNYFALFENKTLYYFNGSGLVAQTSYASQAEKVIGTLTIKKNGTVIKTFDGSNDIVADIAVPTDYIPTSEKGANKGVATLDENGHILSTQLPSYVDDVLEGYISEDVKHFYKDENKTEEITASTGKIYVDLTSLRTYRWGGTTYAEISESLALGETETTAYRGDRGKVAYDFATTHAINHAPSDAQKNSDITKAEIEAKLTGTITSHTHNYPVTSVAGKTGAVALDKSDVGLEKVENVSPTEIRAGLTKNEVVTALGYTPPEQDTHVTVAAGSNISITTDATDKITINAVDEKVKTITRTGTTNYYLTGTTSATTGSLVYDTGIKMGDSNGELIMKMCNVNSSATPAGMVYDSEQKALRFIVS